MLRIVLVLSLIAGCQAYGFRAQPGVRAGVRERATPAESTATTDTYGTDTSKTRLHITETTAGVEVSTPLPEAYARTLRDFELTWYESPYTPRDHAARRFYSTTEGGITQRGLRLDTMLRLGGVVSERGGDREEITPHLAWSILAGFGASLDERNDSTMRQELVVAVERTPEVAPLRDRRLPMGPTLAAELSIAALEGRDRFGLEASAVLRIANVGIVGRIGYDWGIDAGPTRMIGLQFNTDRLPDVATRVLGGAGSVVGGALLVVGAVALAYYMFEECDRTDCRAGMPQ